MAEAFGQLRGAGIRHDLAGRTGMGRNRPNSIAFNGQLLAEAVIHYVQGVLRRAAPGIKERFIRERLSANFPTHQKGKGGGVRWIKLPLSAGLRKITGRTQRSVRTTITSPGTNARQFRGTVRLSIKVGGGDVQWAHQHENSGRMQFGRVTQEEYAKVVQEIRGGVAAIAAQFGGTVN